MTRKLPVLALAELAFLLARPAAAQTDEIQVYDAAIADRGVVNLMMHSNFTPIGRTTPNFPGAIIPDDSFNGTLEWAYGVRSWFEQGLYLPVVSPYSKQRGATFNGFKIRELFVRPHAEDHEFFYGMNFEFSFNQHYWEPKTHSAEVRPIVGVHLHGWDYIFNPIVDTDYTGGIGGLEFVPAARIARHLNPRWAVAAEEYADFGTLRQFKPSNQQFQEVWGVVDHTGKIYSIEAGVGVGVSDGADKLTFKFMIARDLNPKG